jgi:oligoribonuclease (3'-5' exoribonuclease)
MAASNANNDRLIWIDLEMTGLATGGDSILEIATVVTDSQLNVLAVERAEPGIYNVADPGPQLDSSKAQAKLDWSADWRIS